VREEPVAGRYRALADGLTARQADDLTGAICATTEKYGLLAAGVGRKTVLVLENGESS
jgi:hypothetical protein